MYVETQISLPLCVACNILYRERISYIGQSITGTILSKNSYSFGAETSVLLIVNVFVFNIILYYHTFLMK